MPELTHWESFYVIVGAAAGALIGLQFVVMTLIADKPVQRRRAAESGNAFATPTIVHFSAAFFLSSLVSAPWHTITALAAFWGLSGFAGVVYMLIVARRMARQKAYRPVLEDRVFHIVLPVVAYAALILAACVAPSNVREALFAAGGCILLLVFIGIHNAWDTVAYLVTSNEKE
jgi:hypothetical protein